MSSVPELEEDIAATRSRLNETIDRIQGKLTVSGIVDEVMGQAGVPRLANGHDFVMGLLRRNPIPIMIAAAGLGFVIYRMNKRAERGARLPRVEDGGFYDHAPLVPSSTAPVRAPDLSLADPATDTRDARL